MTKMGALAGVGLAALLAASGAHAQSSGAVWLGVGLALVTLALIIGLHLTRPRAVLTA